MMTKMMSPNLQVSTVLNNNDNTFGQTYVMGYCTHSTVLEHIFWDSLYIKKRRKFLNTFYHLAFKDSSRRLHHSSLNQFADPFHFRLPDPDPTPALKKNPSQKSK